MILYHGTTQAELPLHPGLCLAASDTCAGQYRAYNGGRYVHEASLALGALTVLDLDEGYDRDANLAPADLDPASFDADVIVFTDETPGGKEHLTYRLLTARALAALTVTGTTDEEDY